MNQHSSSVLHSRMRRPTRPNHLDPVRALIFDRYEDNPRRYSFAAMSKYIGRNAAYIQQFIVRNTPKTLPEIERRKLAGFLGVSEGALRSSELIAAGDSGRDVVALQDGNKTMPGDEGELLEFEALPSELKAMVQSRRGLEVWRLNTSWIAAAGYLPGDYVIVDLNAHPKPGSFVLATVRDGRQQSIFRLHYPPALIVAPLSAKAHAAEIVDDDRVTIRGVVQSRHRLAE